jgi:hypothetical protein
MNKYNYSAFGMDIQSELPLPLPRSAATMSLGAIIEIVEGPVPSEPDLPHAIGRIKYGQIGDAIQFDVPWAARYRIEGASRIVVQRVPGAKEDLAGLYLSGLILATMLGARGIITLHGSAVVTSAATAGATAVDTASAGGIIFIGDKGAGKSTTAAALAARGYRILCDDVIPIAEGPLVYPGIPLPKLLPDAYEKLIGNPRQAPELFDGVSKYQVSLPSSDKPVALRMIIALEIVRGESLRIEPVRGGAKIQRILQNTMSLEGIDEPGLVFDRCAARLAAVPCYRVLRPAGKHCLDELIDAIIELDQEAEAARREPT